jgi:hypothetical protein
MNTTNKSHADTISDNKHSWYLFVAAQLVHTIYYICTMIIFKIVASYNIRSAYVPIVVIFVYCLLYSLAIGYYFKPRYLIINIFTFPVFLVFGLIIMASLGIHDPGICEIGAPVGIIIWSTAGMLFANLGAIAFIKNNRV